MTGAPARREKAALKAAAAALDIKPASDLMEAMEAGDTVGCSGYEVEQSLIALGMEAGVARGLLKRFEVPVVLYWILRAEGKSNPSGFIRRMLESGAARGPSQPRAFGRAPSADPDAQAQALYEQTKAESRARKEGGPTTDEAWAGAMTSLAQRAPWARAELERRTLLREKRLAREGGEAR
jgi:hypothetical protein